MIMLRKRQRRKRVIVVLEGAKASRDDQKGIAALRWGLREIVDHKDDLLVLIILNPMDSIASPNVGFCCLGGDQPQHNILCGDKFIKFSHDQINERRQAYLQIFRPFYQRCKRFGVKFQVKVAVGKQPIEIMIEEANGFKATWIIVDRCFGGDKSLHGNFNIVLVNDDEEAEERKLLCTSDGLGKSKVKEVKLHPRSLEIFTEPELDFYPRSPKLLKEYVSQEEPHIRDSFQTSTKGERRSFHLSFLVNLTIESENQFNVEAPINENENESKIKKPNDEIGDPMYFSNMSTMESENLVTINQLIKESDNLKAETSTEGLNYYTEQNVRKKILKDKKETRARSALDDHISFGRYSGAMIVLRQPSELSWEEIVEVTSGFRLEQCISKYDEFEMYDGYLMDPYVHSMIKKLNGNSFGVIEAEKRVACSLFHRNIMVLSAYHESAKATVLVYPMAEQGSLDKYLYDFRGEQVRLAFKNRMKIATGVGRCLRYLHEECPRGPVVHANLQTCHIFLTHDFQPLVSGFERAIWLQFEQMVTGHSKSHEDTSQYESMELVKADVFSFGVLLLRLFCLRNLPEDNKQLVELARPLLRQGAFHELLDQDMEDLDMYEIYRVMSAAIQCTKKKPLSRPSMSQVVSILRGENLTVIESSPSSDGSVQGG